MKFNLHGHSSHDPKRSRVPSQVVYGSATYCLEISTYMPNWKDPPPPLPPPPAFSFPPRFDLKRKNNISTPRTHIYIECEAPLQHHKNIDKRQQRNTYYNFWEIQGGGGVAATNIKVCGPSQKIMEYQWVCCHLSSTLPLHHPPDSCSSVPAFSDHQEPLPLLHH